MDRQRSEGEGERAGHTRESTLPVTGVVPGLRWNGVLGKGRGGVQRRFWKLMELGVSSGSQQEPAEIFDCIHLFREGF